MMTAFECFQRWMNTPHDEVEGQLAQFTNLTVEEIIRLMEIHRRLPDRYYAQRVLASHITADRYGYYAMNLTRSVTMDLFGHGFLEMNTEK